MPSPPRVNSKRIVPPRLPFTKAERALIARLNTPSKVQRWLNALPYNTEKGGETLRSFRPVARLKTAHCCEAALFAAVVMEQHGYPPLVMSLESQDWLDHVIFVYRHNTGWGSVARSRDPGLHGRKPRFRSPRALARSYYDGYVDYTGRLKGFGVANLADALRRLRLAADDEECVEGRADADRLAASEDQDVDSALSGAAQEIQSVSRRARRSEARLLSRQGQVGAAAGRVYSSKPILRSATSGR